MSMRETDDTVFIDCKRMNTGQLVRYTYTAKSGKTKSKTGVFYRQTQKGRYIFYNFDRKFRKYTNITDIQNITAPDPYKQDMDELCEYISKMKELHDWYKKFSTEDAYKLEMREYKLAILGITNMLEAADITGDTADNAENSSDNCYADDNNILPQDAAVQDKITEGSALCIPFPSFYYMGHCFKPAGWLCTNVKYNPNNLVKKLGDGLYKSEGRATAYCASLFWYSHKYRTASIFLCLENNKYYMPGVSDMYEYTGVFRKYTGETESVLYSITESDNIMQDSGAYVPFAYSGYHFKPAGQLHSYDKYNPAKLVRKLGEGLFIPESGTDTYCIHSFYKKYGYGNAHIFQCLEDNKYYMPCIADMYEFTGAFSRFKH